MLRTVLAAEILLPMPPADNAVAPEWLHILPAGDIATADGRGPYRLGDAVAVIAASMAGGHIAIDENHSIDLAAPGGGASPAVGWIVELQAREDGIWARVDWNRSGQALLADRAYRGISPVFTHDKQGRVHRILRAALTNTPNLPQLRTLHTSQTGTIMDLATMRQALGLPETADEAAVMERIAANAAAASAGTTALQAQQAETQRIAAEMVALQAQLSEQRQSQARQLATAAIDGAIRAGKPIPAALREHYIARHMADAASVEKEFAALPCIIGPGIDPAHEPPLDAAVVLNSVDRTFMRFFGQTEAAFVKTRRGETMTFPGTFAGAA